MFVEQSRGAVGVRATYMAVLHGQTWIADISASDFYFAGTWSARRDVMLVPESDGSPIFEHSSATTITEALSPYPFIGAPYDDPVLGGVIGVGNIDAFIGEYVIGFRGPGGDELCDGRDGDGDGLVDCADPDCWWTCTPACPPGAC